MQLTVTDVTDFGEDSRYLCVAGVDGRGNCFRPTKNYFTVQECRDMRILPGVVLEGQFKHIPSAAKPHVEDCSRAQVRFDRLGSMEEFKAVLEQTVSASVEAGFDVDLSDYKKCIPEEEPPGVSIVTIKANPRRSSFVVSKFNGKLRYTFVDMSGEKYAFMPLADHALREYVRKYDGEDVHKHLNQNLSNQKELFLRIGVGRCHSSAGHTGYWLQVNGVYTFPGWIAGTRGLAG